MRAGGGRLPWSHAPGLCVAFVESRFNISKGNKNGIGSFDYGIFQIYRHFCCKDYWSHSENICHEDCQGSLSLSLSLTLSLPSRHTEPQSSLSHQLCKKDCVWSRGYEELGSMEVALCRPATLLLDDRMFLGMRQDTGLL
ncbi:unnamed protein product [Nyctereutes procyonoides]|uniref:(raccoon dog) hypothetical protein n=1 Tax=Nyctereutes procyonoides TaxID=34880 RepID=A0A811Y319_NYCPR|nr:unnamed protein product [Nyctereutes procyonoides]